VHSYLERAFTPVNTRFAEMEKRLDAIEKSVADFTYKGVWEDGTAYVARNSVSCGGSMWICMAERTVQRPGDGSDWTLVVKRGRDAR
jgi:hypothetical protein